MGQYHVTVNLSKKEFVHPHALGDGLKLIEQAGSGPGIGTALILLLAASNGYGGGDFDAGDQVAIVGDYAEPDDLAPEHEAELLYDLCGTRKEAAEQTAHLADYTKNSVQPEYAERAARLQLMEPYADITPLVCSYLEREGIAAYGDGPG